MTSLTKVTCFGKVVCKRFRDSLYQTCFSLLFVVTNFQDIGYEVGLFIYFLF